MVLKNPNWIKTPKMYHDFYSALSDKGIQIINTPDEYNRYHLLPGWYDDFREETAETVWNQSDNFEDAMELAKGLHGSYLIKDYVKSRKHEWNDACFIKDIEDRENTARIVNNFISRQGSSLVGGIVLRRFESLRKTGVHEISKMPLSEEYRIFILLGEILVVGDYWTDGEHIRLSQEECYWIKAIAERVKSNFVTVDLAGRTDGRLIIIEFGEGQVSGLQQVQAEKFYREFVDL